MAELHEKQVQFTQNLVKLIEFINRQPGYVCVLGEVARSRETAQAYAKKGIGVADSIHTYRLGADIMIFRGETYLTQTEDYHFAGAYWKSLHLDNRWGGDFKKIKDGNHFSMTYGGRA